MPKRRHTCRPSAHSTVRHTTRAAIRVLWRAPDDLRVALSAFRRALRCHHRLARIAPRFFDSVIVERERREREARQRWMAEWEPVLARVYGCEPEPRNPGLDLPPLPPARTQRVVERELAAWAFWMSAGRMAMDRYQQRRPHDLMDLSRLARLLDIGFEFGRLACGLHPRQPDPEPANYGAAWADLKRAYGHQCGSASPGAASPPASPAERSSQAPGSGLLQAGPAESNGNLPPPTIPPPSSPPELASQPLVPSQAVPPRRDAWSRWARHLRRLHVQHS